MIRKIIFLFIVLPLLWGCNGQVSQKSVHIGVIPKGKTHIFWRSVHAGALKAAQEHNVNIIWESPDTESDMQTQIQIVQNFISKNVNAIVVAPLDSRSLVPVIKSAGRRKIPVIILDSGLESEDFVSFVATDNYKGGEFSAEILAEKLEEKGKVIMLRFIEGSASTTNREQGFLDRMAKIAPEVKIISSDQYAGATIEEGIQNAAKLLEEFPQATGIYTPNETSTYAMLEALKKSKKAGKVKFVGFDATDVIIEGLKNGEIDAITLQDPFQMGYEAVSTAVKVINGESVERRVETKVALATQENINTEEVQLLLYPEIEKWLEKKD